MNENERMPIDSDLLLTFARIAECGNLTVAAGKLGRTQSAISVQLRKLEEGLGVTLFTRTAKGMVLTSAGETLLSRAHMIISEIRETVQLFREPLTGSIRVGLPDDFDDIVLERILAQFSRTHPGVQVLARSGCTSGYPVAIQEGELDVAVCSGLNDLGGVALDADEIVWAACRGTVWSTTDILPLAVLDRPCYWRDLPKQLLDAQGQKHRVAFQSGSFTSLQAALRAGVAIGLLPKSCAGEGLQILTETDGLPTLPTSYRSILTSDNASEEVLAAMVSAIQSACEQPIF
ncbi:MAG: LysR family transcriptional regulator [Pseudomonadota bacterium]